MSSVAATKAKRIAMPRPMRVEVGPDGRPTTVGGTPVEAVREDWVVEDRWWTGRPLRRRYFELVLTDGRNVVVFHDLVADAWLSQRG
jgi:hypothetical protein